MSLNKKTMLIIGTVFLCLVIFLFIALQIVQIRITAEQEKAEIQSHLEIVNRLLHREIELLDILAVDWAHWDDTYEFINDKTPNYVESNLVYSTFEILQLDYMIFLDVSGEVVFARGFDRETGTEMTVPSALIEYVFPEGPFTSRAGEDDGVRGVAALPGNPMLVAARPILKSDDAGPARGTLVFARRLNHTVVQQLSELPGLPLFFEPLNGEKLPAPSRTGQLSGGAKFYTSPVSEEEKAGYTVLQDIHGDDALVLTIHTPREIYKFARTAERLTGMLLVLVGITFAGSMIILLKRNVITRLEQLSHDVKQVGVKSSFKGRVGNLPGGDELTVLSGEINNMLAQLENSQQALHYQLELEKIVSEISSTFVTLAFTDIDGGIDHALKKTGDFFAVDRSYVFLLSMNNEELKMTHEWCNTGIEPHIDNLQHIPVKDFPWSMEKLNQFETVIISSAASLPPQAAAEKAAFQNQSIKSILSVPIVSSNKLLGFMGFDSVTTEISWSDEQVSLLKIVAEMIGDALVRQQAAKELLDRDALQQLLMKLATDFINISPEKVDATINEILESIGKFTRMERVYIFMHDFPTQTTTNTHEWCENGISPQIDNLQSVPFKTINDVLEACQKGETFHVPNVDRMPTDHELFPHLKQQDIKSLVLFPLMHKGVNIGFVGFDAVREIKSFTATETGLLKILTEIISNALARQQTEQALQDSNRQLNNLLEQTSDWVWEMDGEFKFTYNNLRAYVLTGYSPAEITGKTLFDMMLPAEAEKVRQYFETIVEQKESFALYNNTVLHKEGYPVFFETSGVPFFDQAGHLQGFRGISRDITARQKAEAEAVRVEALQAMENERMRLARELHDEIGMLLLTLKLDMQMLSSLFVAADNELQEKLRENISKIDEAITNVRQKSASLRPPALDVMGLIKVVKNLVEMMNRKTEMKTWLKVDADTVDFSPEIENTLYRCIQEAMTNAARHAAAANLNVELSWDDTKVNCTIRDDGTGFDLKTLKTNPEDHLGLQGMKERVFLVRGTIEIKSAPGEGTAIYITIPLRQKVRSE